MNSIAKYFDCHFHIIDKNFPVVPNQGFMPDAFTSEDYLERLKAVDLCGGAVVSVWRADGMLACDVRDSGWIHDELVGRLAPSTVETGGRGLWLVNHLCDLVQVRSGPGGVSWPGHWGAGRRGDRGGSFPPGHWG